MADALTYDRLRQIAARAVGLDQANLSDEDTTALNEIPNIAVETLANARRWPRLVNTLRLTTQAPYSTGTVAIANGAFVVTLTGGVFPASWTAGASIEISGGIYTVATRDSNTQVTLTTAFTSTTVTAAGYTLFMDWVLLPADFQEFPRGEQLNHREGSGYGPICLTTIGQINSYRAAGLSISYPTAAAVGGAATDATNKGRLKLELWPSPRATYELLTSYRRRPTAMSSGSDQPDLPVEMFRALRIATRMVAKEEFGDSAGEFEGAYQRAIADAWRILCAPELHHAAPLRDQAGGASYARGTNTELDSGYIASIT